MLEREMEDLLWLAPNLLLGEELSPLRRQVISDLGRADLILRDQDGALVIIEVKRGSAPRGVGGQIRDYLGAEKLMNPDALIRLMVVANSCMPARKAMLANWGIELKEIAESRFRDVAISSGYVFRSEANLPQSNAIEEPEQRAPHSSSLIRKESTHSTLDQAGNRLEGDESQRSVEERPPFSPALLTPDNCSAAKPEQSKLTADRKEGASCVDARDAGLNGPLLVDKFKALVYESLPPAFWFGGLRKDGRINLRGPCGITILGIREVRGNLLLGYLPGAVDERILDPTLDRLRDAGFEIRVLPEWRVRKYEVKASETQLAEHGSLIVEAIIEADRVRPSARANWQSDPSLS
jgi:hypothetical protein